MFYYLVGVYENVKIQKLRYENVNAFFKAKFDYQSLILSINSTFGRYFWWVLLCILVKKLQNFITKMPLIIAFMSMECIIFCEFLSFNIDDLLNDSPL